MEELGDATMLSNGNIVFCRKIGASEITPDKKIIWDIVAPKDTEIHSVQPLGLDRVLIVQNGNPAKLMIIHTVTGKTEKELTLPDAASRQKPSPAIPPRAPDQGRHVSGRASGRQKSR